MYPITCMGGYPIPIKKGKFTVWGFNAVVTTPASASRLTLVDSEDFKEVADTQAMKPVLCDVKGVANGDGTICFIFPEPIKVRHGVSIGSGTTNIQAGRTTVFIQ